MVLVTHSADRFPFIEAVAPDMLKLEEMDECELSSSATLVNILRSLLPAYLSRRVKGVSTL